MAEVVRIQPQKPQVEDRIRHTEVPQIGRFMSDLARVARLCRDRLYRQSRRDPRFVDIPI